MNKQILEVKSNEMIAPSVFKMELAGDVSEVKCPGQFINITIPDLFLRRPISVCDITADGMLTIIYKVVGEGTKKLSEALPGSRFDCLLGLGNGFDKEVSGDKPLLIGGGVGIPPLYLLAKNLIAEGKQVTVILGFNSSTEKYFEEEFKALGANVLVTTVDGSSGIKGFAVDPMKELEYTYVYACGPMAMLKAVHGLCETDCQLSFEARMGCGFGACMGCSIKTKDGYRRVCKEGPVFFKEEILWED